jgi:hypothetical protein
MTLNSIDAANLGATKRDVNGCSYYMEPAGLVTPEGYYVWGTTMNKADSSICLTLNWYVAHADTVSNEWDLIDDNNLGLNLIWRYNGGLMKNMINSGTDE